MGFDGGWGGGGWGGGGGKAGGEEEGRKGPEREGEGEGGRGRERWRGGGRGLVHLRCLGEHHQQWQSTVSGYDQPPPGMPCLYRPCRLLQPCLCKAAPRSLSEFAQRWELQTGTRKSCFDWTKTNKTQGSSWLQEQYCALVLDYQGECWQEA